MPVVVVLTENWDPETPLLWAGHFAKVMGEDLQILRVKRRVGDEEQTEDVCCDSELDDEELANSMSLLVQMGFEWLPEKPVESDSKVMAQDAAAEDHLPDAAGARESPSAEYDDDQQQPEADLPRVSLRMLQRTNPVRAVLEEVAETDARMLIIPRHPAVRANSAEFEMERQLYLKCPCETCNCEWETKCRYGANQY